MTETEEKIRKILVDVRNEYITTNGAVKLIHALLPPSGEGSKTVDMDNWIAWLQARIPILKDSTNVFWLKQAMQEYAFKYAAQSRQADVSAEMSLSDEVYPQCLKSGKCKAICLVCYNH